MYSDIHPFHMIHVLVHETPSMHVHASTRCVSPDPFVFLTQSLPFLRLVQPSGTIWDFFGKTLLHLILPRYELHIFKRHACLEISCCVELGSATLTKLHVSCLP